MKTYWLFVLALLLADAAVITWLLVNDGGPENLVWWSFLIIPIAVLILIAFGILLHLVRLLR